MTRLVLLAGPSGGGKSRLARLVGAFVLRLDDFYRDADAPGLPHAHGIIDWDDPATWDAEGALAALDALLHAGRTEVPTYSIAESRRTGSRVLELGEGNLIVAEGIFAVELLPLIVAAGLPVTPVYLDRDRTLVAALRLRRDLAQHRKSVSVLLRRGASLWRSQPDLRDRAVASGFIPLSMRAAIRELSA